MFISTTLLSVEIAPCGQQLCLWTAQLSFLVSGDPPWASPMLGVGESRMSPLELTAQLGRWPLAQPFHKQMQNCSSDLDSDSGWCCEAMRWGDLTCLGRFRKPSVS